MAEPAAGWALAAAFGAAFGLLLLRLARLEAEAGTDPLTGLANRRGLARAWARRGRGGGLLFLDLDGFKGVNDRLGHAAGDRLLAALAGRMASAVTPADCIGRWGGDEFVVLTADPRAAAARLAAALRPPFHLGPPEDGGIVRIGFSAGRAETGAGTPLAQAVARAARVLEPQA